jgi:adenylate cyclase
MATEIEHKFLVRNESWQGYVYHTMWIRQGYLVSDEIRSVRVRITDGAAYLNIKSATLGITRSEYEYSIPLQDAGEILDALCDKPLLEKTRHLARYGNHVWEIDVFEGDNAGLVVAEVELASPGENFARPPWIGEEVSHDRRYYNAYLARHSYKNWQRS